MQLWFTPQETADCWTELAVAGLPTTRQGKRYANHPDAAQQGIYLVLWFGPDEAVAGRKGHGIKTAADLSAQIRARMPVELKGAIDVFSLDLSRQGRSR